MLRGGRRFLPAFRAAVSQLPAAQQAAHSLAPAYAAALNAAPERSTYNVPEGHWGSDLSDVASNIGLNRRRDLTLRQDLSLYRQQSKHSLADVFKVRACGRPQGGLGASVPRTLTTHVLRRRAAKCC
jgi:hypothetical protein